MRKRTTKTPPDKENLQSAVEMFRFITEAVTHTRPWPLRDAADFLERSEKTIRRYVAASHRFLLTDEGQPILSIAPGPERRSCVYVRRTSLMVRPYPMDYVTLLLGMRLAHAFEGTGIEEVFADNLEALEERLAEGEQLKRILAHFDRKFFIHETGGYKNHDPEILEDVLHALLYQKRLKLRYNGWEKDGVFEPLTLMLHKEQLYLVVRHRPGRVYTLALTRIQRAKVMKKEDFRYPKDWDPTAYTPSPFGLLPGKEQKVSLLFPGKLRSYFRDKRFSPNQEVTKAADGRLRVTMRTPVNAEFMAWIISFGEVAEVESPASLRTEIGRRLRKAAARYA
jgi:predicted DNA-binding transcriptional regulator YafY